MLVAGPCAAKNREGAEGGAGEGVDGNLGEGEEEVGVVGGTGRGDATESGRPSVGEGGSGSCSLESEEALLEVSGACGGGEAG